MTHDSRCIGNGFSIPSEGYADQPYVVKTDDGAWLCVMTTGAGDEGQRGQHVVSRRSLDHGHTWSDIANIEPADGPEASYAVLLKAPSGRIYCFYNHNTDNVREVVGEDTYKRSRVDSLGHYVFRFSDDHGRTWSAARYDIPVREFACDRQNLYGGKIRFFWNVGRPLIAGDVAYLVLHKVAALGEGFYAQSEGAILRSDNLLCEPEPAHIHFETLPDGDVGLRTPPGGGRVSEEQSLSLLSDGSLYCVYRCVDGWPVCAYSRDGGHTWTPPQYKTYTPAGRRIKHPRAANFAWRCANGQFLYWFHNHGGASVHRLAAKWDAYMGRNPAWLCAGREVDSPDGKVLEWSQPEILLYDDDVLTRMSYPDLIEEDGRYFVTETQKTTARVHAIDPELLNGLFNQWTNRQVARRGLALELVSETGLVGPVPMPRLPDFRAANSAPAADTNAFPGGFTIDLWVQFDRLDAGQILLDTRVAAGQGILIDLTDRQTLQITLGDARQRCQWDCDAGVLRPGRLHHVAIIVDDGPRIITFVVDGVLCDGGDDREYGWGRFTPTLLCPNASPTAQLAPQLCGQIRCLRVYSRYLRSSEAVGNWHAGCPATTPSAATESQAKGVRQ
jgi:hypothetical protein